MLAGASSFGPSALPALPNVFFAGLEHPRATASSRLPSENLPASMAVRSSSGPICFVRLRGVRPNPGCMESLWQSLWSGNRFLGVEWEFWKCVGWLGNAVFFSRFLVQWYVTEKRGQVVVPGAFWWLSLAGSLLLFLYGLHVGDLVFIFAYAFTWIPYLRNLVIHQRHKAARQTCGGCETLCLPSARFCHHCGLRLPEGAAG